MLAYAQTLRNFRNRIVPLGDLNHRIPFEFVAEFGFVHHGLKIREEDFCKSRGYSKYGPRQPLAGGFFVCRCAHAILTLSLSKGEDGLIIRPAHHEEAPMTKDEITAWALANGWAMIDGFPSLTKPTKPHPAIVRLVLKATVASVEIKKPAGKWEKVSGESYSRIAADPDSGMPGGLGLGTISGLTLLMQDNQDRKMMAGIGAMKP